MSPTLTDSDEKLEIPSRRRFFRGRIQTKHEMRLPWVISDAVFTSGCTQCQNCINSCDSNIIVKDEDGFPKIDFSQGECTFCDKCIDSCEQPLFSGSFTRTEAEINQKAWPVAITINDTCLAKNNIYCQSCRDECEPNVIKFNYTNSSIPTPSINDLDCTQCGACIKTCPQEAIKFTIETNAVTPPRESV